MMTMMVLNRQMKIWIMNEKAQKLVKIFVEAFIFLLGVKGFIRFVSRSTCIKGAKSKYSSIFFVADDLISFSPIADSKNLRDLGYDDC